MKVSKTRALEHLRSVLDKIPQLRGLSKKSNAPEFIEWQRDTKVAIKNTFMKDSEHITEFNNIHFAPVMPPSDLFNENGYDINDIYEETYSQGMNEAEARLKSMIKEINAYWEDEENAQIETTKTRGKISPPNRNIFIIHGHDDGAKETVARFIKKIGLNPIILHEHSDKGRTIIEKFEEHSDVGYAIALLTPDDVGNKKNEQNNLKPRARQNVIFEFGYFIGKIGRKRVCGIKKDDVEIPSDYAGVLFIPMDSEGAWQMKLVKELKEIWSDIDANLLFKKFSDRYSQQNI